MKDREKATEFLNRSLLTRISGLVALENGASIQAQSEDGLLLYDAQGDIHLVCADTDAAALDMVDKLPKTDLFINERTGIDQVLKDRFNFTRVALCFNAVYLSEDPLEVPGDMVLRPLDVSFLPVVKKYYTVMGHEDIKEHLEHGNLFGGYAGDSMVGFVGIHWEGSIGMLHVFEEHRRRRHGYAMEALMVNRLLSQGRRVYAQIYTDNEASIRLHHRLGMTLSPTPISWLSRP
jgi:tRNA (guanine37-N1)-methyltransferase